MKRTAEPDTQAATDTVGVVIVNWNTGERLRNCLHSIECTDRSVLTVSHVAVVDNASQDGSATGLELPTLALTTVCNTRNRGFAAACNQGAAGCADDYLLFLNPDTELYPDTLRAVGEFLHSVDAADVGICGGLMLDEHGGIGISCSRFPSLGMYLARMTGLSRALPDLFPPHHLRPADLSRSRPVDQVIGAFFLVRREVFEELGGFDERYFLYLEEVDFSLRARRRGWRSYYVREARVLHVGNVSSGQLHGRRLFYNLRSRSLYAFRHWPRWQAGLLVALTATVEPAARLAVAFARRDRTGLRDVVTGYAAYLRWLLRPTRTSDLRE